MVALRKPLRERKQRKELNPDEIERHEVVQEVVIREPMDRVLDAKNTLDDPHASLQEKQAASFVLNMEGQRTVSTDGNVGGRSFSMKSTSRGPSALGEMVNQTRFKGFFNAVGVNTDGIRETSIVQRDSIVHVSDKENLEQAIEKAEEIDGMPDLKKPNQIPTPPKGKTKQIVDNVNTVEELAKGGDIDNIADIRDSMGSLHNEVGDKINPTNRMQDVARNIDDIRQSIEGNDSMSQTLRDTIQRAAGGIQEGFNEEYLLGEADREKAAVDTLKQSQHEIDTISKNTGNKEGINEVAKEMARTGSVDTNVLKDMAKKETDTTPKEDTPLENQDEISREEEGRVVRKVFKPHELN